VCLFAIPVSKYRHGLIIAGSPVAGLVLLIVALATLFVLRKRRRRRQQYWALSRAKRHPSRSTFLAGEEMDLPFPNPPFASLDRSDPFATYSSHRDREWVVASAAVVTVAACQLTLTLIFFMFAVRVRVVARSHTRTRALVPTPLVTIHTSASAMRPRLGIRFHIPRERLAAAAGRLAADGPTHISERRSRSHRHGHHGSTRD
jgi:hypothetical protein